MMQSLLRVFVKPNVSAGGGLRRFSGCAAVWCACLIAVGAAAQDAVLFDLSLEPEQVVVVELDTAGQRVVYYDAQGDRAEAGFDEVLRLVFPSATADVDRALPVLATTDGQRIVGRAGQLLRPALGDEESVGWRAVDALPGIAVSLDDLAWVVLDPSVAPPSAPTEDDVLVLGNGEQLSGFIDTLGLNAIGFEPAYADAPLMIPPARVNALIMSNQWSAPEGPSVFATLASGSRWRCELGSVEVAGVGAVVGLRSPLADVGEGDEPAFSPVHLGVSTSTPDETDGWPVVTRLDFQVGGHRLVPLSSLAMQELETAEPFGVPVLTRRTADGALAMHAPATVSFELPARATRLSATVALALGDDVPEARRAWAGCVVVVAMGEVELARVTIDHEQSEQRVNVALPEPASPGRARALTVTIEEGVNGPILDRIELRDAEVLVVGG
ncbi:MAG: hypothetical protein ACIAXF_08795 [Phycisphaerales bacterium JB063]